MPRPLRARAAQGFALGLTLGLTLFAATASGRPFTVADLLHEESLGAEAVDPTGRWIVFERRDAYDTGRRFDGFTHTGATLTRLFALDLAEPRPEGGRARPLLRPDPGPGVNLGPFSPDGRRLAVYRLRGARLTLGVVTLQSGRVRWFDITPEDADWSPGLQWLDSRQLLVIARPDRTAPWTYSQNRAASERLPALWAATATGAGGRTVVGSGAYVGLRPTPRPDQLLRLDSVSGHIHELARGRFFDLQVAPDRRHVALFATGSEIQPRPDRPVQGAAGISTNVTEVSLLDLTTGRLNRAIPGLDALPHLLSWSPSGRRLLLFARQPGALWSTGRLLAVDPRTGAAIPALSSALAPVIHLRPETLGAGWMGEDPILLARPAADPAARRDWYRLASTGPVNLTHALPAPPSRLAALDATGLAAVVNGEVWKVDPNGAAVRLDADNAIPAAPARTAIGPNRADVTPPQASWIVDGPDGGRRIVHVSAAGLAPLAPLPRDAATDLAASFSHPAGLVSRTSDQGVQTLLLVRPRQPPRSVARLNAALAVTDAPIVRAVPHRGPDGEALTSWLFLPPGATTAPPILVVMPYAGAVFRNAPQDEPGERGLVTSLRALVGHGYAVLVPSLPRHDGEPIAGIADQLETAIRAAAGPPSPNPPFDIDRVALWGHSFGGYTALAAISQTDRYCAAVSIAGVSDFLGKWAAILPSWRAAPEQPPHNNWSTGSVESGQEQMGGPPWIDPDRWRRNSPLLAADHIHTPVLLAHGDQDVIPLEQSEAMYAALYRQAKDAILVTYWGESHMMMNPGNVRDLYARAFALFDSRCAPPARARAPAR